MNQFFNKYPRWIVLQLTEKCNLRCKMCYEWGPQGSYHHKEKLHQLDAGVLKKMIADCSPGKPLYDFFGGEPLMYDAIGEVIAAIKSHGSEVTIPTNGTLLAAQADMLVETAPDVIWVSLDGPEAINDGQRGKGVLRKSLAGLARLHELRRIRGQSLPKLGIIFIITPANYLYLEDFFFRCLDLNFLDQISIEIQLFATAKQCREYADILSREFGIKAVPHADGMISDTDQFKAIDARELVGQIRAVSECCKKKGIRVVTYPKTVTEENYRRYYAGQFTDMIDYKKKCLLPWIYTEITASGDVSPCHIYYDLSCGNINERGFLDIWNGDRYRKFREVMKRQRLLPMCTACSRFYDC